MANPKAKTATPAIGVAQPAPTGNQQPTIMVALNPAKPYKPRKNTMHNTQRTWQFVQQLLANGPITQASLTQQLQAKYNHPCFVKYAIGRGWLTATAAK